MEVQLGRLAQQQAKDQQVVQFGQRMVQDHGQANEKLMAIARQKAIQLPQELSGDAQQKYEEMQQLLGAEFDEAYMDEMVEDHERTSSCSSSRLSLERTRICVHLPRKALPTLREHLELAKQCSRKLRRREKWSGAAIHARI